MAKETPSSSMWLPSLLLAAIAATSYLVQQTAFQSSRPAEGKPWSTTLVDAEQVEARLWEDPLSAVDAHVKKENGKDPAEHHKAAQVSEQLTDLYPGDDAEQTTGFTVLAVMVPRGPYWEHAERRRRIRYGVLASLGRAGFVPADQEHLQFYVPKLDTDAAYDAPRVVPYEFLQPSRRLRKDVRGVKNSRLGNSRGVLVLWLPTAASQRCPLHLTAALLQQVAPIQRAGPDFEYMLIGPTESGTLAQMTVEAVAGERCDSQRKTSDGDAVEGLVGRLQVYSPWASAADRELSYTIQNHLQKAADDIASRLANSDADRREQLVQAKEQLDACLPGIKDPPATTCDIQALINRKTNFVRLIADDVLLASALFEELELRGIDPACWHLQTVAPPVHAAGCDKLRHDRRRIAIVSEWDAPYQRSLQQTLARIIKQRCYARVRAKLEAEVDACSDVYQALQQFAYLRGLDGQTGEGFDAKPAKQDAAKPTDPLGTGKPAVSVERADGNGQFDYLRRLADQIAKVDADSGIGAIGVLGSDVYDKLTILQALRERFPDKVFFTTGLDARLLHPDESKWAKNLIVITPFGLQLEKEQQRSIPPLRDAYQTSVFHAVQQAMRLPFWEVRLERDRAWRTAASCYAPATAGNGGTLESSWLVPQVVEIGRTRQIDLVGGASARCGQPNTSVHATPLGSFPRIPQKLQWQPAAAAGLGTALLLFALWPFTWPRAANGSMPAPARFAKALGVAAIAGLAGAFVYFWNPLWEALTQAGGGEPAYFFEGVSVWPTQMIRVFGILLAVVLLVVAYRRLKENTDDIKREFPLDTNAWPEPRATTRSRVPWLLGGQGYCYVPPPQDDPLPAYPEASAQQPPRLPPIASLPSALREGAPDPWQRYCREAAALPRCLRVTLWTLACIALCMLLFRIWPVEVPARGPLAYAVHRWVTIVGVGAFTLLLCYVVDALFICNRCIQGLISGDWRWPEETAKPFRERLGLWEVNLDAWITVQLIARRTQAVGRLIYYPFFLLFLTLVSRNPMFERWTLPLGYILLLILSCALLVWGALKLRWTTETARTKALRSLSAQLIAAKGKSKTAVVDQLNQLIDEVRNLRTGAFAPYSEQQFVRALLLPFAGYAGSVLIEYLTLVKV